MVIVMRSDKPLKTSQIAARIEDSLKKRMRDVERVTGLNEAAQITAGLQAICDYVEKYHEVTLPLSVFSLKLSDEEWSLLEALAKIEGCSANEWVTKRLKLALKAHKALFQKEE